MDELLNGSLNAELSKYPCSSVYKKEGKEFEAMDIIYQFQLAMVRNISLSNYFDKTNGRE